MTVKPSRALMTSALALQQNSRPIIVIDKDIRANGSKFSKSITIALNYLNRNHIYLNRVTYKIHILNTTPPTSVRSLETLNMRIEWEKERKERAVINHNLMN